MLCVDVLVYLYTHRPVELAVNSVEYFTHFIFEYSLKPFFGENSIKFNMRMRVVYIILDLGI